jgi:hypothetical protein
MNRERPMSDPLPPLSPDQLLPAYADDELDAARRAEVLTRLASDPAAARAVEGQVRLRAATARAMRDVAGPDAELTRKVEAMAWQMPPAAGRRGGTGGRWMPRFAGVAAAIALVGVGVMLGRYAANPVPVGQTAPVVAAIEPAVHDPLVPVSAVSFLTRQHVLCSRFPDHHPAQWPAQVAKLEEPVRQYLGGAAAHPDLTGVGYHYVGCGPCGRPTETSVHMMYHGRNAGDVVSLFIEPYHGQVAIAPGACYACTAAEAAHPVIVWRTNDLVFYLVGDGRGQVEKVRQTMKLPQPI